MKENILSPVGRLVSGSVHKPKTTDAEGKPLVVKNGPNAGTPRVDYYFAVAFQKGAETHWSQTPWGAKMWACGHAAYPQAAQSEDFSWKVIDGDSQKMNKEGKRPCDNEGFPGHWIVKFSGGYAPAQYRIENGKAVPIPEADFIKTGYYVEVYFNVDKNDSLKNPGIYVNHSMVCFRAYGQEISFGPDANEVGFGQQQALPAGATLAPQSVAAPVASIPTLPTTNTAPPAHIGTSTSPSSIPVIPNHQFVQNAAGVAPAPPAPPARQMTAMATAPYEAYVAAGWTDAALVAAGIMLA